MSAKSTAALLLGTAPAVASTWSTTDIGASITLSNGNLTATATAAGDRGGRATSGKTVGKWYFECVTGATWTGGDTGFGLLKTAASLPNFGASGALGIALYTGNALFNGASLGNHGLGTTGAGVVVGCAVDLSSNLVWFTKDGVTWTYTGSPVLGTNGKAGGWTTGGLVYPAYVFGGNGSIITARFALASFTLAVPTGFSAWG